MATAAMGLPAGASPFRTDIDRRVCARSRLKQIDRSTERQHRLRRHRVTRISVAASSGTYYVYAGLDLVRVCPPLGMAREVAASV